MTKQLAMISDDRQASGGGPDWNALVNPAALQRVALFNDISTEALNETLAAAQFRPVPSGGSVFDQGSEARTFFVLLDGCVRVSQITKDGQQVILRFVVPGEQFGCIAVFGGGNYPGEATAIGDCLILAWDRPVILDLMQRHSTMAINALQSLGLLLTEIVSRMREMSTQRVEKRIAHTLLRLADRVGRTVGDGVRIDFPVLRQDIAEMVGTTLHTVSRVMSDWQQKGIVEGRRRNLVLRQPDQLRRIAEET